ncbi:MAG: apolipoprotein N-acyltransferase, partial [Microcoleus sp.]
YPPLGGMEEETTPYPPLGGKQEETPPYPPLGGMEEETTPYSPLGGKQEETPPYPPLGGKQEETTPYPPLGGMEEETPPYPPLGGKQEETTPYPPLGGMGEGRRKNWITYLLPGILCLILHIVGWSLYNRPLIEEPGMALKIGIIQGNIPNEIKFDSQGWRRALEGYTAGYKQLADRGVDVVLIPETALPFFWTNDYQRSTLSFYQAILDRGILALVGGFGQEGDGMTNSLLAIDKTGEILSRYDKTKLVPLGEYIPFYEILGGMINRLSPLDAHLVPGNSKQLFDTPFGRAIVGICYDSAFSEIFRYQAANGGEFMLTASNNAHYKPPMLAQHHALDVMRAIETDRWAAIATNTGYSAFVNPHGETLWMSGINTYEVQDATIYRRQTQTLYVRWGDRLTPLLLVLAGLAVVWYRIV